MYIVCDVKQLDASQNIFVLSKMLIGQLFWNSNFFSLNSDQIKDKMEGFKDIDKIESYVLLKV